MSDVYCPTKFKELQVHVQSRLLYNCCKAWPERIDLDWLENNPGKLFHTPTMVADRQLMLEGKRSKSCEHGCYQYEDQGLTSARDQVQDKKIMDVYNPLETLQISLSNDCNLTCAYCSSEWSTAWHRDIDKNGEYNIEGYKNKNDNWSELWSKIKQKDRSTDTRFFKLLCNEISLNPHIKNIKILGGEPLLNNHLHKILDIATDKKIKIISGLGVDIQKLKKITDHIKDNKNISFDISAEGTGDIFEFVRHGARWNDFLQKIDYIKDTGVMIDFLSVISNITSFGIVSFYDMFSDQHKIAYNSVIDRPFLQPNVLDDLSKQNLLDSIKDKMDNKFFLQLKQSVSQEHSDSERKKLSVFLKEFARRRKLKLDIFPVHFLKWLDLN
jgi:organic radical activating enzyme